MADTNIVNKKIYKTPEYTRRAHKAYRDRNPDKIKKQGLETYYKNKDKESYKEKKKAYLKKRYEEKKKTITPEEKAAKSKYMREYRARKKMEIQKTTN